MAQQPNSTMNLNTFNVLQYISLTSPLVSISRRSLKSTLPYPTTNPLQTPLLHLQMSKLAILKQLIITLALKVMLMPSLLIVCILHIHLGLLLFFHLQFLQLLAFFWLLYQPKFQKKEGHSTRTGGGTWLYEKGTWKWHQWQ